jgi:hypothetical protein
LCLDCGGLNSCQQQQQQQLLDDVHMCA